MIALSTPLARKSLQLLYSKTNLVSEYIPMLNGFVHSYMLIGILIFIIGLIDLLINKNN